MKFKTVLKATAIVILIGVAAASCAAQPKSINGAEQQTPEAAPTPRMFVVPTEEPFWLTPEVSSESVVSTCDGELTEIEQFVPGIFSDSVVSTCDGELTEIEQFVLEMMCESVTAEMGTDWDCREVVREVAPWITEQGHDELCVVVWVNQIVKLNDSEYEAYPSLAPEYTCY